MQSQISNTSALQVWLNISFTNIHMVLLCSYVVSCVIFGAELASSFGSSSEYSMFCPHQKWPRLIYLSLSLSLFICLYFMPLRAFILFFCVVKNSFFKFFKIKVDLQCCANFCCMAKWPSHTYVYISFLILSSIIFYPERVDIVPCARQ